MADAVGKLQSNVKKICSCTWLSKNRKGTTKTANHQEDTASKTH